MIDADLLNGTALSFIGDAIYSLKVREHLVSQGYHRSNDLQRLTITYVSAKGQTLAYEKLKVSDFLSDKEEEIFKRGRNAIGHIPKNGNLHDYSIASGLEAVCGYLYLKDLERLERLFEVIL